MIKTKVAFLEGRLLTSQSEQFKKLQLAGKKPALQKRHFCFDHVNRRNMLPYGPQYQKKCNYYSYDSEIGKGYQAL